MAASSRRSRYILARRPSSRPPWGHADDSIFPLDFQIDLVRLYQDLRDGQRPLFIVRSPDVRGHHLELRHPRSSFVSSADRAAALMQAAPPPTWRARGARAALICEAAVGSVLLGGRASIAAPEPRRRVHAEEDRHRLRRRHQLPRARGRMRTASLAGEPRSLSALQGLYGAAAKNRARSSAASTPRRPLAPRRSSAQRGYWSRRAPATNPPPGRSRCRWPSRWCCRL